MGFQCEFCGEGCLDIIKFTVKGKDFCGERCAIDYRHEQLEMKFKKLEGGTNEISKRKARVSNVSKRRASDS